MGVGVGVGDQLIAAYLARDGETFCLVDALDDAPDALHGAHELCELVSAQVGEARDGARRAY